MSTHHPLVPDQLYEVASRESLYIHICETTGMFNTPPDLSHTKKEFSSARVLCEENKLEIYSSVI